MFQCCRKPCHHHPDGHPRRRPCRTLPMKVLEGGLHEDQRKTNDDGLSLPLHCLLLTLTFFLADFFRSLK